MSLTELKTLQDWVVERAPSHPYRASRTVSVLGGKTKEFQAESISTR